MPKHLVMLGMGWWVLSTTAAFAAIPNTSDYLHKTMPMISGTVVAVDDRQIVVDTDQEQRVTLVMDSHTILPVDLAPGMMMRAEFRVMENGQYYANRITPIRGAKPGPRVEARAAEQSKGPGVAGPEPTSAPAASEAAVAPDPVPRDKPTTLPQTAGDRPLLALLGLSALSAAGVLMLMRRTSRV